MKKKPFWSRCNRGFVVSMALLAAVVIYVIVSQLMLMPARQDIRKLADSFRGYMENTSQLSDEQIDSLKDEQALVKENNRLKSEISPLFNENSNYVDSAVQYLTNNMNMQTQGLEHVTSRSNAKVTDSSCIIDQDVATYKVTYSYKVSGGFYDYKTEGLTQSDNVKQELQLTVICKKVDNKWKINRISQANWIKNNKSENGGAQ